jgi:hypothetical protein
MWFLVQHRGFRKPESLEEPVLSLKKENYSHINFRMRVCWDSSTVPGTRRRVFVRLLRLRIKWEVFAWRNLYLPVPVLLKRFFALECVFILGMISRFSYLIFKVSAKIRKI